MIKTHQRGFTLIELVVVIVILGILAAFAVPRFMGMEGEARAATVKSMGGTLLSAASIAHSKCQAQSCGATGNISFEGKTVTMVAGYPNRNTIDQTLQTIEGFNPTNPTATERRYSKIGAATTNCWVSYNVAVAPAAPTITYGVAGTPGTVAFNQALSNAC